MWIGVATVSTNAAATACPTAPPSFSSMSQARRFPSRRKPRKEIQKEIKLALQDAARQLGRHLAKKAKRAKVSEKFTLVNKILPEINKKASSVLGKPEADLAPIVCKIMDVVWVEDPQVEYVKLEGQMLPPAPPKPAKDVKQTDPSLKDDKATKDGKKGAKKGTLDAFAEEPGEGTETPMPEPAKPRQAFLAKGAITMTNYMMGSKKFRFYAVLPDNSVFVSAEPKPKEVKERYISWDIPPLKPTEKLTLQWEVAGVDKGGLDDADCYVSGINEVHVVGADPWHGGEE
jgi:hypothetical protein